MYQKDTKALEVEGPRFYNGYTRYQQQHKVHKQGSIRKHAEQVLSQKHLGKQHKEKVACLPKPSYLAISLLRQEQHYGF